MSNEQDRKFNEFDRNPAVALVFLFLFRYYRIKKMKKSALLAGILLALNLFSSANSKAQPCGGFVPKNPSHGFKLKNKYSLPAGSPLQTNGVYLFNVGSAYQFYRFFSNGRFFSSNTYCSYPTRTEFADLNDGWKGYYTLKNNQFTIEVRSDGYSGFTFSYGTVNANSIILESYKSRGISTIRFQLPSPMSFSFVPMPLSTTPNW